MATIEEAAYNIIDQKPYSLNIAGENITFRQATLDDLERISAIASVLPTFNEIDDLINKSVEIPQLIDSFKYARTLGDIIMVTAEINISLDKSQVKRKIFKSRDQVFEDKYNELYNIEKKRIEDTVYKKASIISIWAAVQQIMKSNHVFFYQNTITFLKGMNHLKPTKETDQTVRT